MTGRRGIPTVLRGGALHSNPFRYPELGVRGGGDPVLEGVDTSSTAAGELPYMRVAEVRSRSVGPVSPPTPKWRCS